MRRLVIKQNETGFATVIVIILIVVMGLLLAGLIPLGTTVTQSAAYTRNALQAQYIAEAGAKRAIAALSSATATTSWTWLDGDPWHNISVNPNVESQYRVNITTPGGVTLNGTPPVGTYGITSRGQYGNFFKTVRVQVTIATGTLTNVNTTFAIGGDITTNPKTSSYTFSSNGDVEYFGNRDASVKLGGNLFTNNNNEYINQNDKLDITEINIPYALSLAANETFQKPIDGSNDDVVLDAGKYYKYDSDLDLNSNNCGIVGPTFSDDGHCKNDYAVVVVNGSLTFSATSAFHIKGNVIFLVKDNFIFNSNETDIADGIIYCNGDAIIKRAKQNVTLQMIVDGSLILENDFGNCNPNFHENLFDFLNATVGGGAGGAGIVTVSNWEKGT